MFPTHVGMNRLYGGAIGVLMNVPHTRGDEPQRGGTFLRIILCSPHTWG